MAIAAQVPTLYKYTLARPRAMSGDATCVNEMAGCWQLASFYLLGTTHIPLHGHPRSKDGLHGERLGLNASTGVA